MKIIKLINMLNKLDINKDILISSDEEGNHLYKDGYIDRYNRDYYMLYGVKEHDDFLIEDKSEV